MFISLEGIEGSGKTTQINNIYRFLEKKGHDCVITREPGGTKIGKKIRSILLDPENNEMEPMAELLLYFSDRVQHVYELIKPALSIGKTIICDRYFDATLVYQGYARGLDMKLIMRLHDLVLEGLKPDITFLLDLSPEIGLSRAWEQIDKGSRTGDETRFEKEALSFHQKIRAGYLELARLKPKRFQLIDASQEKNKVQMDIEGVLALI
ncbi:MAG: dTMP kinase [Desulfobacterales bacterium]|nr:dTMP kinase [Deltaproteobacteria bacterium]NNL41289.1 dTMP kinase [Desulfobacterales bacterium]